MLLCERTEYIDDGELNKIRQYDDETRWPNDKYKNYSNAVRIRTRLRGRR